MSLVVFPAGPADAEALAQVHVAAWRESYRGLLPDAFLDRMSEAAHARRWRWSLTYPGEAEVTLVAVGRHGLVGYVSAAPSRSRIPGEGEITTLYLLREAQGQGAGRRLVGEAARVLDARGAGALMISVLRDNLSARGFYEHLGGLAETPRPEPGPAGVLHEVAYRWPDIRALFLD